MASWVGGWRDPCRDHPKGVVQRLAQPDSPKLLPASRAQIHCTTETLDMHDSAVQAEFGLTVCRERQALPAAAVTTAQPVGIGHLFVGVSGGLWAYRDQRKWES